MVESKVQASTEPNVNKTKAVVCLNDMKHYESLKEAAEAYNLSENAISSVCMCHMTHVYGLKFVYADSVEAHSTEYYGKDLRDEIWR